MWKESIGGEVTLKFDGERGEGKEGGGRNDLGVNTYKTHCTNFSINKNYCKK